MKRSLLRRSLALAPLVTALAGAAMAQLPDAGRLLQENVPPPPPPRPSPALPIQPPPAATALPPGGPQVAITSVRIEGLSTLPAEPILQALAPAQGRSFDLAGLRGLADQVTEAVRAAGYPFARAYIPVQDMAGGVLRIAVLEGRYGQVRASDPAVQAWLAASLQPGAPILGGPLERSLLLLDDIPGLRTQPVLQPGEAVGTGDLIVQAEPPRRFRGEAGVDNHGNRYAGRERLNAGIDFYSLAAFGDQLTARGNVSREGTWLGQLAYSLPLGMNGWRAQLGASRTDYVLGREFQSLGAHGTADTLSAGVSYPIVRSRAANVRFSATLQGKRLHDARDAVALSEGKHSAAIPLVLSGDRSDGRGVSWGSVALTFGRLDLDDALQAVDRVTAQTDGSFQKINLDAARLHALGGGWTLYGRLAGQWASQNLDSSEKFVPGGATGVRAWPSGEAAGDEGLLGQIELRLRIAAFEPFVFIDGSRVRLNRKPWAPIANKRDIAGGGLGVRWVQGPWQADAAVAWRDGGTPTTEPGAGNPQAWLTLAYRF